MISTKAGFQEYREEYNIALTPSRSGKSTSNQIKSSLCVVGLQSRGFPGSWLQMLHIFTKGGWVTFYTSFKTLLVLTHGIQFLTSFSSFHYCFKIISHTQDFLWRLNAGSGTFQSHRTGSVLVMLAMSFTWYLLLCSVSQALSSEAWCLGLSNNR